MQDVSAAHVVDTLYVPLQRQITREVFTQCGNSDAPAGVWENRYVLTHSKGSHVLAEGHENNLAPHRYAVGKGGIFNSFFRQ